MIRTENLTLDEIILIRNLLQNRLEHFIAGTPTALFHAALIEKLRKAQGAIVVKE